MRWVRRHQLPVLLVLLVVVTWGALFTVYDYRSPVAQFIKGIGTVQLEGWSAYDLDAICMRLEATGAAPVTTPDNAMGAARLVYPGGDIRVVELVSFRNTCTGASARLSWAVAMVWPSTGAAQPASKTERAVVLVDAHTGQPFMIHLDNVPAAPATTKPKPTSRPTPSGS